MEQKQTKTPPGDQYKLVSFRRPCWKPTTAEGDGEPADSKFSGTPLLTGAWPECGKCRRPMPLFLQLDLDRLPEEAKGEFGSGTLQLFYCVECDEEQDRDWDAFEPFSKSHHTRIVPSGAGHTRTPKPALSAPLIPAKVITGWQRADDYPEDQELSELGVSLAESEEEELEDYRTEKSPHGDKLGGWPNWVQGIEYPNCLSCGERMRMVFQLDSEDNLAFTFGDNGTGHITQCPVHKEQVAFAWACC